MRPGHALTLAFVVILVVLAVAVAVASPLNSGGHLIAAPAIALAAGGILIRFAIVQERRTS